jgi:hypothetical protein
MADRRRRDRVPEVPNRGEKHGWLRFDRYQAIHEQSLERHPFVVENLTAFSRVNQQGTVIYVLEGTIVCEARIVIDVTKHLGVRQWRNGEQVRGSLYRYHAHIRGGFNILRYDNQHDNAPGEDHRHEYDLRTGEEHPRLTLEREQMPTLIEALSEVQRLVRAAGLLSD